MSTSFRECDECLQAEIWRRSILKSAHIHNANSSGVPSQNSSPSTVTPIPSAELERHQHLQAGLDLLDQGITVIDANLRMIAWNRTFLALLDFPPEMAYVGAPFESFIRYNAIRGEYGPGEVEAQVRVRIEAARAFQPHHTERQRPDGRTLAIRGEPIANHGFVTLYTDVTEQRRYERLIEEQNVELDNKVRARTRELEVANHDLRHASRENLRIITALRRSEERTRMITDNVGALIGYFDQNQIYTFANRRHADWFERDRDSLLGSHVSDIVGTTTYAQIEPYIRRALAGETVSFEYSTRQSAGEIFHARSTLVPERDSTGKILGCYLLAIDLTEQKRAEAAAREAQKMRAIGQLSGGLAHDFNNILTVIIGNLDALDRALPDSDVVKRHAVPALRAAQLGANLVRRLLAIARQQPLEAHPIDVGALLLGMAPLLRGSLPESISIRTRLGSSPNTAEVSLWALTDPGQLEDALINLALNARDAMPAGGNLEFACDRVCLAPRDARSHNLPAGNYIEILVTDGGQGMDATTRARAFDPFFTTKPFGQGSGLGLAMVQGFVHQSGGQVQIESMPGKGTSIRLLLPATLPAKADSAADPAETEVAAGGRVLLVEDDPDVRAIVRDQINALGYAVLEAENGQEAVQLVEHISAVEVVVSDIVMPGDIDGYCLARIVTERWPDIGIVLMSGYKGESRHEPQPEGNTQFLGKPFLPADLKAAIRRCRI